MNTKIRFGRVETHPKNTLATVLDGETIYFGIARCNTDCKDHFTKARGVELATVRAGVAQKDPGGEWKVDGSLHIHQSGLFGQVAFKDIVKLLKYFDDVDENNNPNKK